MLKPLRRSARLLKKREKLPLQLPLEVLELILEYSLPPCPPLIANISATSTTNRPLASWFIFPLRSEQLCAIALVSRQCRRWAQRELLRHIVLDSDEAVDRLLEAWEPLSVEERASRGIVTETLRIGHDDEDEPIRLGDRFERLLMLLQPDELVAVGTGLRELWFLSVTDVNLRSLARLQDLRLRFCDAMGVSTPMSTPPPGAIDMPYLPLLRTLVISLVSFETDEDEASPPIFPHHEFTNLEILSFDEFDALRAIFGCDSWMLPKLRAFQPGRDTPAALYASPNQPATPLDDTKRDPNDDFLKTHGLRSDTLLCLHLDGDTLPNFSSFGPLLSDNLVKIVIEDAVEHLEREDLEAFVTSPHFRRLLASHPPSTSATTSSSEASRALKRARGAFPVTCASGGPTSKIGWRRSSRVALWNGTTAIIPTTRSSTMPCYRSSKSTFCTTPKL
ncbi:hypothetical protein NBRC10512_005645 [Rhodotorula toruloides]|uniref:RHTO0S15e00716g1_1 n=2 Tax=Rhodotorula toruloides TaxID=5286 RepID=A0A061BCK7_RHOTO|nr:uncharacterized protein RHTO_03274 [Rhodotorula toruloides NP11]EMS25545.1 hypothetical protein RHTO_03274 [Rhodotorula toruloides NP11]CDR47700.1 RHTO0S15e00716g1_1 [Rhodotorula toruloides]